MAEADPIVAALTLSLEKSDDAAIRLHLAQHLMASDRHAEALDHAQAVLARTPADPNALRCAATAARQLGSADVAGGYESLLAAIEGDASPRPPEPPPHDTFDGRVPVTGGAMGDAAAEVDEFDAFLDEVLEEDRRSRVRLDDVGGMTDVKEQLERSFFLPIRQPEMFKAYGRSITGGLLLYGPPGCGKTFLAKAIAGELGARFVAVALHDVLDMYLGVSEGRLHAIFEEARRTTPTVLFLDEIDALGQKRSNQRSSAGRNIVAQLLTELDGIEGSNDGVYVVGATNAPWDVDAALRRPGRFDRTVLVLPPDAEARHTILAYHLRDRPTEQGLDLNRVAKKTDGLSGADLRLVCDHAAEMAFEQATRSGRVEPVSQKLLEKAAKSVKPSITPWLETARNYVTFANQDGQYDDLAAYLRSR